MDRWRPSIARPRPLRLPPRPLADRFRLGSFTVPLACRLYAFAEDIVVVSPRFRPLEIAAQILFSFATAFPSTSRH